MSHPALSERGRRQSAPVLRSRQRGQRCVSLIRGIFQEGGVLVQRPDGLQDARFGERKCPADLRQKTVPDQIAFVDGRAVGRIIPPFQDLLSAQEFFQVCPGVVQKRTDERDAPDFLHGPHGAESGRIGTAEEPQQHIFDPVPGVMAECDKGLFRVEDDFSPVFQTDSPRSLFVAFAAQTLARNVDMEDCQRDRVPFTDFSAEVRIGD